MSKHLAGMKNCHHCGRILDPGELSGVCSNKENCRKREIAEISKALDVFDAQEPKHDPNYKIQSKVAKRYFADLERKRR